MLRLCNVSLRLEGRQILEDISLSLPPHRLTALVGKNGSGKSSLLSCVNQLYPYSGKICHGDQDLSQLSPRSRAKSVAILPQSLPAPHILVREMVAFGRNPYLDFSGRLTQTDREAVSAALHSAHAHTLAERYVDTLSGGERQRAALAMILAQDAPTLLLDEPTAHMDKVYEASFLRLLAGLKSEKNILVVLHDLSAAVHFADDLIVLDQGKLVFAGPREDCLDQRILEQTFSLRRYTAADETGSRIFFFAGDLAGEEKHFLRKSISPSPAPLPLVKNL